MDLACQTQAGMLFVTLVDVPWSCPTPQLDYKVLKSCVPHAPSSLHPNSSQLGRQWMHGQTREGDAAQQACMAFSSDCTFLASWEKEERGFRSFS